MNGKTFLVGMTSCLITGGISAFVAYSLTKKKYIGLADKEVESIIKKQDEHDAWLLSLYGIKVQKNKDTKPAKDESTVTVVPSTVKPNEDRNEKEAEIRTKYTTYAKKYGEESVLDKEQPNKNIYVISSIEFNESSNPCQSVQYYAEDGVVADVDDNRVNNYVELVGPTSIWENKFTKDNVVYVRNDTTEMDYEIILCNGKWEDVASASQKAAALLEIGENKE